MDYVLIATISLLAGLFLGDKFEPIEMSLKAIESAASKAKNFFTSK